MSSTCWEH